MTDQVTKKLTTDDIRAAMIKTWAAPEHALVWEVAPATGVYVGKQRYADAMIMSLWPSRGQHLHGVEIKANRQDWLKEAKDPGKAERMAAFCDFWWIHTIPGVIHDMAEVPMMWGVRIWDGKKWKTLREAVRTEALPVDRGFLASLMRRSDDGMQAAVHAQIANVLERERESMEKEIERRVAALASRQNAALEAITKFKETSGIDLLAREFYGNVDPRKIGAFVKIMETLGVGDSYDYRGLEKVRGDLTALAVRAGKMAEDMDEAIKGAIGPLLDAGAVAKADLKAAEEAERARTKRR